MSSKYVRDMVEGWLGDVALAVPYYPTVNEDQNPGDAQWCTVDFSSSFRDTLTFCAGMTSEEGELQVIYFGEAGVGEDALLTAIEADMLIIMAKRDPANKLVLMQRSAPFEFSGGSASKNYGLSIFVDYQFYE